MEKPISNSMVGVDALLATCRERRVSLMVGYVLRFYTPLRVVKQAIVDGLIGRVLSFRADAGQYLPDWREESDYRKTVSARRDLGGGAVLELSHELDYARWLFGEVETVMATLGNLGGLGIDVEDTAEIILEFENGIIGSVHLDMVQRVPTRMCRIVGTEGTLLWDGVTHNVCMYTARTREWIDLHPKTPVDRNEMYMSELRHFFRSIQGEVPCEPSGEDGKRALEIALAAIQSSQEKRPVVLHANCLKPTENV